MKKYLLLPLLAITTSFLFSCNTNTKIKKINLGILNEENDIKMVKDFALEYEWDVPGSHMSYETVWGNGDFSEKRNKYTYKVKYSENIDDYYLLYLNKNDIKSLSTWFFEYEEMQSEYTNHFINDDSIVDGKYALGAQKNNIDDVKVMHVESLEKISYEIETNYQLVMCLQGKTIEIVMNASRKESINKEVRLLRRFELQYDKTTNKVDKYEFTSNEKESIEFVDKAFSYVGSRLEVYPIAFESMDYCYAPFYGFGNSYQPTKRIDIVDDSYITLKRYETWNEKKYDLLEGLGECPNQLDVYFDFREEFKSAFIEMDEKDSDYAHYDISKVIAFLK